MPRIPLPELSEESLDALSVETLVQRMDLILRTSELERYGEYLAGLQEPRHMWVRSVVDSPVGQRFEEPQQRRLAYLTFQFLLQMQYGMATMGAMNALYYDRAGNDPEAHRSPALRITKAALDQYGIISSRIAFECFMELLHFLGERVTIRSRKSKLGTFKKWVAQKNNPYAFFARHLLTALHFDRKHRSPEIHGASKLMRGLLVLGKGDGSVENSRMVLLGALMNVWAPLQQILNGERPTSMSGPPELFDGDDWLGAFASGDDDAIDSVLSTFDETYRDLA